jgi:alanine racemase
LARPTRIHCDPQALRHNLAVVRSHAPRSRVMGVVKAEAYGHGLTWAGAVLADAGVDALGVACLEEAQRLRQAGVTCPVFLLAGTFEPEEVEQAAAEGLGLVLHREEQVAAVRQRPGHARPLPCFLKVDSGMHRLGFSPTEAAEMVPTLRDHPAVQWHGVLSHLARADDPGDPYNAEQRAVLEDLRRRTGPELPLSLANSGAVLAQPEAHWDWVRPGLMLYGASPFPASRGRDLGLRPVMRVTSRVEAVRQLAAGEWLGYGRGFCADREMRVGVVPMGYGDGYSRHLPTGTPAVVEGESTRLLGRVCMDLLFVDLDAVPQAGVGSPVELVGPSVPIEDLADRAGTIPYELLCNLRGRQGGEQA